jgi:GLPGLI family protein
MKEGMVGSKISSILCVLLCTFSISAQTMMSSGKITFERRTNLEKRYAGQDVGGWMKGRLKEPKIDEFELRFTDSTAIFVPILPEVPDEREWATMQNTTYQNLNSGELIQQFSFWGTQVLMKDTVEEREWIITGSSREIAGYNCRQAMWEANDSTRIYAWYADELMSSVGPETFNGLPGVILGLGIEDGGVVYFAKKIEELEDPNIQKAIPTGKAKDWYTEDQLRSLIKERFSKWGQVDRILVDMFVW